MWHGIVGNYCLRLSLMIENGMERNVFESLNGKSKLNRELAVNLCIDDLCVPWQTAFSYSCIQYIYCSMRKILSAMYWQPAHYSVLSRVRLKRLWQHTEAVLIKQAFECSQVAIRVLFGVIKKISLMKAPFALFLNSSVLRLDACRRTGNRRAVALAAIAITWARKKMCNCQLLGCSLHSEGNNPAHSKQMWGLDGEWCKTAAPRRTLVNLATRQFESRVSVLLGPNLSRASAGDTSGRGSGEYAGVE